MDQKLRALYHSYKHANKKFFDNRLPKGKNITIVWKKLSKGNYGFARLCEDGSALIGINPEWKKWQEVAISTLLHEMVHLDLDVRKIPAGQHGTWFEKGMIDLANQDAFLGLW